MLCLYTREVLKKQDKPPQLLLLHHVVKVHRLLRHSRLLMAEEPFAMKRPPLQLWAKEEQTIKIAKKLAGGDRLGMLTDIITSRRESEHARAHLAAS